MNLGLTLCAVVLLSPTAVVGADEIITGTRTLDKDTYIKADTITFKDGALIVTNGFRLTLDARLKIVFEGTPKIISFDGRSGRAAGDPGRSAGPIIVQTALLDGT